MADDRSNRASLSDAKIARPHLPKSPPPATAMRLDGLRDGRHRIEVLDAPPGAAGIWTTSYPHELIYEIHAVKGAWVCDEIMREEDPRYVENAIRREVFPFVPPQEFAGKRILDFGCGAGASTLVLARLLPPCEIVGIELKERLLRLAESRVRYLGGKRAIRLELSPSGTMLPENLGEFDYIILSAVYEHLLPEERSSVLPSLWRRLKPNGVLFINQTPHRYWPVEVHTTMLPLINYLPDRLAHLTARLLSKRVNPDDRSWETMLRDGIRGATRREILSHLDPCAVILEPMSGDLIDLWYGKLSKSHAWLKRTIWGALKVLKRLGAGDCVPELTLAIRKN